MWGAEKRLSKYAEFSQENRKEMFELIAKMPKAPPQVSRAVQPAGSLVQATEFLRQSSRDDSCRVCGTKHLGAAKVLLEEATASTGERQIQKVRDAMFQMNEAETRHLQRWPEVAVNVRNLRKMLEPTVFEGKELIVRPDHIDGLIDAVMLLEETDHHKHERGESHAEVGGQQ